MPAKSKAQQQFLAICEHDPKHATGHCPAMTTGQLHDYAATKTTGLPTKVKKRAG